jgi:hypothetical protein
LIDFSNVTWNRETGMPEGDCRDRKRRLRRDRAAVGNAQTAGKTAADTGAAEGASANGISANLTPYLTGQLLHPTGYSQGDMTQQLNMAEAGAGGANSSIEGDADLMAARSRNPAGFTGALDEAARQRDKAAAGASEGIATNNAQVKLGQQQDAAKGLSNMYGEDTDAMLKSMGIQTGDINAEIEGGKEGWLQNMNAIIQSITGGVNAAANASKAGAGGGG